MIDTQTNKQLFINSLAANLTNNPDKPMILNIAAMLIPAQDTSRHIDPAGSPIMQIAIRAYRKSHPKYRKLDPPIELVIDWLLRRGGITYAESVEKKLHQINEILLDIGEISMDEVIFVEAMKILTMRVLSDCNFNLED